MHQDVPKPSVTPGLSLPPHHTLSRPDLQMHTGPVDGVLPGHPRKKPLPGHAVVPALLPDVQGLLCKQDAPAASAIAELMTRGPAAPPAWQRVACVLMTWQAERPPESTPVLQPAPPPHPWSTPPLTHEAVPRIRPL